MATERKTKIVYIKTVVMALLCFFCVLMTGCGDEDTSLSAVSVVFEEKIPKQEAENEQEWSLILVNPWNYVPEDYEIELVEIENGYKVDSRIYEPLKAMLEAARAEGIRPHIYSSYRTENYQRWLYNRDIEEYMAQGLTFEQADAITRTWVAYPGTSEHQLGLALDITSENINEQPEEVVWEWLKENAYKYGFILRYTEEKMEFTGINPEPWHYRYVGKEAAKEIYEQGVCLEEYLENKK